MDFSTEYNTLIKSRDSVQFLSQERISEYFRKESIKSQCPDLTDRIIEVMSKAFENDYLEPNKINFRVTLQLGKLKDSTLTASPEKFLALKKALVVLLVNFAKETPPDPELEGLSSSEAAFMRQQKYGLLEQINKERLQKLDTATSTTTTTSSTTATTTTATELATATTTTATETATATTTTATATELATATTTTATETATATTTTATAETTNTVETTATALSQLTVAIEETTTKIEVQRELPADESTEETPSPYADIIKLFDEDAIRFDENGVGIKPSEFLHKLDSPSFQKRDTWMRCINNRTPPAPIEQPAVEQEVQA